MQLNEIMELEDFQNIRFGLSMYRRVINISEFNQVCFRYNETKYTVVLCLLLV